MFTNGVEGSHDRTTEETRMRRSAPLATLTGLLAVTALAGTAVLPGAAQAAGSDPAAYTSHGEVLNILPPGSRGNVDLTTLATLGVTNVPNLVSTPSDPKGALATASATTPKNFADQLEMYDALSKTSPG